MNAGLPGTGIGGVFYLLSALLMPLFEVVNTLRGQSSWSRWALLLKQLVMAAGIIAGMWGLGMFLGLLLETRPDHVIARFVDTHVTTHISAQLEWAGKVNVFHIAPVMMSIATLAIILTTTNVLRIIYPPKDHQ